MYLHRLKLRQQSGDPLAERPSTKSGRSDRPTPTVIGSKRLQRPSAARNGPLIISTGLNAFFYGFLICSACSIYIQYVSEVRT